MESKIATVEAMFKKTESDLNFALRKLDDEYGRITEDEKSGTPPNPVRMAESLQTIKTEFAELRREALELEAAQRDAAATLQREMANLAAALNQLHTGIGDPRDGSESCDTAEQMRSFDEQLARLTSSLPVGDAVSGSGGVSDNGDAS